VEGYAVEELIRHLAWLSRLELREEEEHLLARRLEAARRVIDRLLEADVADVEPLFHPSEREGRLREDKPQPGLQREEALANAAKVERGYVVAPRTVEE
jgi:aspartyl-tRNA(Asn)/glutamyl-tRNA(Gln) amidotransferase subunit C